VKFFVSILNQGVENETLQKKHNHNNTLPFMANSDVLWKQNEINASTGLLPDFFAV
tara:strand:- start:774 stop:941 length:168 start_codon:yes stop_codon:yes gene_type:complete